MKKVLIGTDIILYANSSKEELGVTEYLLEWMARIKEKPCVDISTRIILSNFLSDVPPLLSRIPVLTEAVRKSHQIKTIERIIEAPVPTDIRSDSVPIWKQSLAHLALLQENKVDIYITDSPLMHSIARRIDLDHRVFSVESYLDHCSIAFRDKDPNKGLVIKYDRFGKLNINDEFFNSFKRDYTNYSEWFHRKQNDRVFYSHNAKGEIQALLKLKIEESFDEFDDIVPTMTDNRCLKISSFKVNVRGSRLSERFMRIIFKTAIREKVDSIYVTVFNNEKKKRRLIDLLHAWGFHDYGNKLGSEEMVLKRSFHKEVGRVNSMTSTLYERVFVKDYYPFHSPASGIYLVPLREAFLDLLLGEEEIKVDRLDILPYKNSISKVIAIRNIKGNLYPGAILLFYNMTHVKEDRGIVGVGILEGIRNHLKSEQQFVEICIKRCAFSISHLRDCWKSMDDKDNIALIEFLFVDYLNGREYNEVRLNNCGIDTVGMHSQNIYPITLQSFKKLFKDSDYERDYIAY
ncbi:MAG: hypothetical protein K2H46_00700 [Muribaculaceae bacterium]|nr:hypothetical protein [Muribaculaceae bacterium]